MKTYSEFILLLFAFQTNAQTTYDVLRLSNGAANHKGVLQFGLSDVIIENSPDGSNYTDLQFKIWNGTTSTYLNPLRITSSGNVGIGTTTPQGNLEIRSSGSRTELKVRHQNETENSWGLAVVQKDDLSGVISCGGRNLQIESGWDKSLILGNTAYSNSGGKVLIPGGNVGIGTSNPDAKLTVNGKIKAEEIQVIVDVPADYVFEPNYKLMPLSEVANYVQQNKHLPNVPSAEVIKETGWNVGEMNNKLLEKVEEITFYLIELQNINAAQDQQIKEQQLKIIQLEKRINK
jgi:hypothetical protein